MTLEFIAHRNRYIIFNSCFVRWHHWVFLSSMPRSGVFNTLAKLLWMKILSLEIMTNNWLGHQKWVMINFWPCFWLILNYGVSIHIKVVYHSTFCIIKMSNIETVFQSFSFWNSTICTVFSYEIFAKAWIYFPTEHFLLTPF